MSPHRRLSDNRLVPARPVICIGAPPALESFARYARVFFVDLAILPLRHHPRSGIRSPKRGMDMSTSGLAGRAMPILLCVLLVHTIAERAYADPIRLVDTLGSASASTVFSVFGSGGLTISDGQSAGPRFSINEPTVLTEIGAFVNNCRAITAGVPECPNTQPITVQLRRSVEGRPDPSSVIASFTLSHDEDPLRVAFESVSIHERLMPGTYFVMFSAQPGDAGLLLGSALIPFQYTALSTVVGFLPPCCGAPSTLSAAVRILGAPAPVPEPSSLLLFGTGVIGAAKRFLRRRSSPEHTSALRSS